MSQTSVTPRRLAFCLFRYFPHGGLQRDMLQIAQACHARGHAVRILTQRWTGPRPKGIEISCVTLSARTNHGSAAQFSRRVPQMLGASQPDGIIGFNKMAGLDVYYAADGCLAARTDLSAATRWLPRYRQYRRLEEAVFSPDADTLILALTPRQQRAYQTAYGTPNERFIQLPPNLSAERRHTEAGGDDRERLRDSLGVRPGQRLLLQVGSSFNTKGLDRSLRALASLPSDIRGQVWLMVAGSGKSGRWERLTRKLGIIHQVRFLGARTDVMPLMRSADLLLHPSRRESAGIVLLEALVAGLPAIVSGACGYGYHIEHSGSGWLLAEPFSQTALDQCLLAALTEADLGARQQKALAYAENTPLHGMVDAAVRAIERRLQAEGRTPY